MRVSAFAGSMAVVLAFAMPACEKKKATDAGTSHDHVGDPDGDGDVEGEEHVKGVESESDDSADFESAAQPAAGAPGVGSGALIAEATRVLATVTSTTYSHKTHVSGSTYDVDCSGFLDVLLARSAPAAYADLRGATVKRPLAKHFVQRFEALAPGAPWERVPAVQRLARGDVIAWTKPADVTSTNTGHVMIVAAAPVAHGASSWAVSVIDSSAAPHGKDDARKSAHATGVGRGTIVLDADEAGAPVGYHWSTAHGSHRHLTTIAMARPLR